MPTPELISILIPAYNAERWISDTIRSALAQSWPRTEIIIVNDGSTDRTLEVSRSFESKRVKVITQPNLGAPVARNRALESAQGSFIQWLDADDLLAPDKLTRQMRVAQELADRWMLLSCPFGTFYFRHDKAEFVETSLWRDLSPVDYFLSRFNDNVCFQTDAWLVSRELTEAAGPWTDVGSPDDDGEYFCRVAMRSRGIRFVPDARTYYRVGNFGSLSRRASAAALRALFGSKVKCIEYLLQLEDSPRTRAASVRLLQDWMPYFHPEQPDLVDEAQRLARQLGGQVRPPRLKWKYRLVWSVLGHDAAVAASRVLPRIRARAAAHWDGFLYSCGRSA
jgi:glycosyltransferase involved in cell wall biosynthesis